MHPYFDRILSIFAMGLLLISFGYISHLWRKLRRLQPKSWQPGRSILRRRWLR